MRFLVEEKYRLPQHCTVLDIDARRALMFLREGNDQSRYMSFYKLKKWEDISYPVPLRLKFGRTRPPWALSPADQRPCCVELRFDKHQAGEG